MVVQWLMFLQELFQLKNHKELKAVLIPHSWKKSYYNTIQVIKGSSTQYTSAVCMDQSKAKETS